MKCPVDSEPMQTLTWEGVFIQRCETCQGIWLDRGQLERIEETQEHPVPEELNEFPDEVVKAWRMAMESARRPLACPRCDREMERREYGYCSQVLIDVCPSCEGVWLDAGELGELEAFFESARAETRHMRRGFLAGILSPRGG